MLKMFLARLLKISCHRRTTTCDVSLETWSIVACFFKLSQNKICQCMSICVGACVCVCVSYPVAKPVRFNIERFEDVPSSETQTIWCACIGQVLCVEFPDASRPLPSLCDSAASLRSLWPLLLLLHVNFDYKYAEYLAPSSSQTTHPFLDTEQFSCGQDARPVGLVTLFQDVVAVSSTL